MFKITATELEDWAKKEPRRAQELLPELIIKLILGSSSKINKYNFPIEKGIQYSGYDGVLESFESTPYFPNGKSVWEFGTNESLLSKFTSDLKKRSENSLGVDIPTTVFIFCSLKQWNHKTSIEEITNTSKKDYPWKDIHIIDASTLYLWIESCPAASTWLAEKIGKNTQGFQTIEKYWQDNCMITTPYFTKEFFLESRHEQSLELLKWFKGAHGYNVVRSPSKRESVLFIISAIFTAPTDIQSHLCSRVIIVTTENAWENIHLLNESVILIPTFNFVNTTPSSFDKIVILPISKSSTLSKAWREFNSLELTKLNMDQFYRALCTLGKTHCDWHQLAKETKGSFIAVHRKLSNSPAHKIPAWVDTVDLKEFIPILLIRGWNSSFAGDCSVVETMCDHPYDKCIEILSDWLLMEDAPLFNVNGSYQIVDVRNLWVLFSDKVTPTLIARLKALVLDVFSSIDPTFDLPRDQWFMANLLNKKPLYSHTLQESLIISLIMIGELDDCLEQCNIDAKPWVNTLISEFLANITTWQAWCSFVKVLPLIVEAAPYAVIEKLEQEVAKNDSSLWDLFAPVESTLWNESYHIHILWALERMLAFPQIAVRAVYVLAKLNDRDITYKQRNSPLNSLSNILCLSYQQGHIHNNDKIAILRKITSEYPQSVWQLLVKLIPQTNTSYDPLPEPKWNSQKAEPLTLTSTEEFNQSTEDLFDLCTQEAGLYAQRWIVIIDHTAEFIQQLDKLVDCCALSCQNMNETDIILICNKIRMKISSFRKFKNATWSIPEESVIKLEHLLITITPQSVNRFQYLFDHNPPALNPIPYDPTHRTTFSAEGKKLFQDREQVIKDLLEKNDMVSLYAICETAKDTCDLGKILTENLCLKQYNFEILKEIKSRNERLYQDILLFLFQVHGWDYLKLQISENKTWTKIEICDALMQIPFTAEIQNFIEHFDMPTQQYYWENISTSKLISENSLDKNLFFSQLLEHNRPFSAVETAYNFDFDNITIIIKILEHCLLSLDLTETSGLSIRSLNGDYFLCLFRKIYSMQETIDNRVIQLELAYLDCFQDHDHPQQLVQMLLDNPENYIDIMCGYYNADIIEDKKSLTKEQARKYYKILEHVKVIPGFHGNEVDKTHFLQWTTAAFSYAQKRGYTNAFNHRIGNLLSFSPVGTDGIFPHEIVREYMESHNSKEMLVSFTIGKSNQRGVHIATNGIEERTIAASYSHDAKQLQIDYPVTSLGLSLLAREYESEAKREDNRAFQSYIY